MEEQRMALYDGKGLDRMIGGGCLKKSKGRIL
jgi:hypothetical protein